MPTGSVSTKEQTLWRSKQHWFVHFNKSLAIAVLGMGAAVIFHDERSAVPAIAVGVALLLAAGAWWQRQSKEIIITDRRVISRTGILRKRTRELPMQMVETTQVSQGIIGRIFGYGHLFVSASGGSRLAFYDLPSPGRAVECLQQQIALTSRGKW